MSMAKESEVKRAARSLRDGGLVGMPTETVYGLAADAGNHHAVEAIFAAKGRPKGQPIIVHIGSVSQLETVGRELNGAAR